MVETPFKLTKEEVLASAAATLCLSNLEKMGAAERTVSELCSQPQYGYTASASWQPCGPRFVRITDIKAGEIEWDTVPYCTCPDPAAYLLSDGDILVARSGSVGKSFLVREVPEEAVFASYMIRLRPRSGFLPSFLYWCLQSQQFWQQVMGARRGSAMKNVNGRMLAALGFQVPEWGVQQAVANFLDSFRARLNGHGDELPLLSPPLADVRRIVARIEELSAKIEEARGLRRRALEEAELLVRSHSKRLFEDAQEKNSLVKLGTVTLRITKGESPAWQGFAYQDSGPLFIRSENVLWGALDASSAKHIPQPFHEKLSRSQLRAGDALINLVGASIGRACLVPEELGEANVNQAVAVISPDAKALDSTYLVRYVISPLAQEILHGGKVETARPNISLGDLNRLPLALPGLPEQRRIVEYLDGLQAKVDNLKKLQEETSKELDALMPSILSNAFSAEL